MLLSRLIHSINICWVSTAWLLEDINTTKNQTDKIPRYHQMNVPPLQLNNMKADSWAHHWLANAYGALSHRDSLQAIYRSLWVLWAHARNAREPWLVSMPYAHTERRNREGAQFLRISPLSQWVVTADGTTGQMYINSSPLYKSLSKAAHFSMLSLAAPGNQAMGSGTHVLPLNKSTTQLYKITKVQKAVPNIQS